MRAHGMGLLAELFDFEEGAEEEARAWLDEARFPRMLGASGVCGGAGYEAVEGAPRFLNLVEALGVHVFYGEEFAALMEAEEARPPRPPAARARLVCAQIHPGLPAAPPAFPTVDAAGLAPVVQFGRIAVPEDRLADFNGWYERDRLPLCAEVPGMRRARRYVSVEGERLMAALYEMEDESARETPEWRRMSATPWTARVRGYCRRAPGSPGLYRRRGYAR